MSLLLKQCGGWFLRSITIESAIATPLLFCALALVLPIYTGHVDGPLPSLTPASATMHILALLFFSLSVYIYFVLSRRPKLTLQTYGKYDLKSAPGAPNQVLRGDLSTCGTAFVDSQGRTRMLRGLNVSGSCKLPSKPDGATHHPAGSAFFDEAANVSFVNRPFPLSEADEHLTRLRSWGHTFLRLLITWEAVEHTGPGQYDEEYLEYLLQIVRKCGEYGISVFIDPHQDVWSRWTGGDGAPGWTLEMVGFDLKALHIAGATISHQTHGDPFPKMIWGLNYQRLASATMFSLFWAGDAVAPLTTIKDPSAGGASVPVQQFLQGHYIEAMRRVARKLKGESNVIGFDTINEPSPGWVGRRASLKNWGMPFLQGHILSPLQSMFVGCGHSLEADFYSEPFVFGHREKLNPDGVCCWRNGPEACVWKQNGVYEIRKDSRGKPYPHLLKPNHFARHTSGEFIHFTHDFQVPFFRRLREALTAEIPDCLMFCESVVDFEFEGALHPPRTLTNEEARGFVWAAHHYDVLTLMTKKFRTWLGVDMASTIKHPVFGLRGVIGSIAHMIEHVQSLGEQVGSDGIPTVVGEIGIPFDMSPHDKMKGDPSSMGCKRTDDFALETIALDANLQALDQRLANYTLWNYTPMNTNHRGDFWNDEDLSVFSADQIDPQSNDLNNGGRALAALIRPYPMATAGTPLSMHFDTFSPTRRFVFSFKESKEVDPREAPTMLFVPLYQYIDASRLSVTVSDGDYTIDWAAQTLTYVHDTTKGPVHQVSLTLKH